MKPGIYPGTTREEYERVDAVNQSTLKLFAPPNTPAHAREAITNPRPPTAAMQEGTAFHCALLEPDRFKTDFVSCPKFDKRTTAGKAAWADFQATNLGKEIIDESFKANLEGMLKSASNHPTASKLLYGPGKNEVAVYWIDPETGQPCKAYIDRITEFMGWTVVLDLKSCSDIVSEFHFRRQSEQLNYHMQPGWYLDGLNVLAPHDRRFLHIAVEKSAPWGIAIFEMDDDTVQSGRDLCRAALSQYVNCKKTGMWPGHADGIYPLRFSDWKLREAEAC